MYVLVPMNIAYFKLYMPFRFKNRSMRWPPMLIKFAIFIRQQSPAVYCCLRDIGVLKLPGESTLQDYTTIFSAAPGFQQQVLNNVRKEVEGFNGSHRYVCVLHAEMSIKSDLVFDRNKLMRLGVVGYLRALTFLRFLGCFPTVDIVLHSL